MLASTDRRGAELFGVQLGHALSERGWEVTTVALAPGRQRDALGVEVLAERRMAVGGLRRLRAAAREVDVVVAHGSTTLSACALGLAGSPTPFVYRNIGDPRAWSPGFVRRTRTTLLLRRPTRVVAIAPAAEAVLAERHHVPPDRLTTIGHAVPAVERSVTTGARARVRSALGLGPDAPLVAAVGALTTEKRVDEAIEAVARIEGLQLVVVGDGPLRADLEASARARLPGRCRFLGAVTDASPIIAGVDAVVLLSRTEGVPGVLVEAAVAGVPSVATHVGFVAEVVVDGETGRLVPPGDIAAASAALQDVLAERDRLGRAARRLAVERFSFDLAVDRWDALLHEVRRATAPALLHDRPRPHLSTAPGGR